jgi:hypothetical protein
VPLEYSRGRESSREFCVEHTYVYTRDRIGVSADSTERKWCCRNGMTRDHAGDICMRLDYHGDFAANRKRPAAPNTRGLRRW